MKKDQCFLGHELAYVLFGGFRTSRLDGWWIYVDMIFKILVWCFNGTLHHPREKWVFGSDLCLQSADWITVRRLDLGVLAVGLPADRSIPIVNGGKNVAVYHVDSVPDGVGISPMRGRVSPEGRAEIDVHVLLDRWGSSATYHSSMGMVLCSLAQKDSTRDSIDSM